MAELTQEYFEKFYQEQNEFLAGQFGKVHEKIDTEIGSVRSELRAEVGSLRTEMSQRFDTVDKRFTEQTISYTVIQRELEDIKKRLDELSKRTREDDDAMASEIMGLKRRVEKMEMDLQKLVPKGV